MAIIALIGPMQVVGRVLLMVGQQPHHHHPARRAASTSPFRSRWRCWRCGISDVYGLILFAIIYGVANGLVTILRGMAVPEFIGPEGYGGCLGALTMPTNVMRAAGPLLGACSPSGRLRRLHAGAVGLAAITGWYAAAGFRRGGGAVEATGLRH